MGKIHTVGLSIFGIAVLSVLMMGFYYFSGLFDTWAAAGTEPSALANSYLMMGGHTFMAILILWPLYTFWISTMRSSYSDDDD